MVRRVALLAPLLALAACELGVWKPDNGSMDLNGLEVREEPPPAEEPPPSMNDGAPPPVVSGGVPGYDQPPGDGPAPGGGEMADGPDAGGGASAPGGTRARVRARSLGNYITADDYPAASLRNNEQGLVTFILDVDPAGRVANCIVTRSSGSAALDSATCRIMRSRARYTPARNPRGQAVADRDQGAVRWQLEG
jgi:periplasmic protein TonB